jgi:CDP-diglyceride synthetase
MSSTTSSDFYSKLKNFGMLIAGAAILGVHVGLFYWNNYIFNIFVCLYITLFAVLVTVLLYKNKSCFNNATRAFNIITYFAFYTIFLQVIMIILSIVFLNLKQTPESINRF